MLTTLIVESVDRDRNSSPRRNDRSGRRLARRPQLGAERLEGRAMFSVDDGSLHIDATDPFAEAFAFEHEFHRFEHFVIDLFINAPIDVVVSHFPTRGPDGWPVVNPRYDTPERVWDHYWGHGSWDNIWGGDWLGGDGGSPVYGPELPPGHAEDRARWSLPPLEPAPGDCPQGTVTVETVPIPAPTPKPAPVPPPHIWTPMEWRHWGPDLLPPE